MIKPLGSLFFLILCIGGLSQKAQATSCTSLCSLGQEDESITAKDFFSSLKKLPIDEEGFYKLSVGGGTRQRYSYFHNNFFGLAGAGSEEAYFHRAVLHVYALHRNEYSK